MLTRDKVSLTSLAFDWGHRIGIFTFNVNRKTGIITLNHSVWRLLAFRMWQMFAGFFTAILIYRTCYTLTTEDHLNLEQVPMMIIQAVAFGITSFGANIMFKEWVDTDVLLNNEFFIPDFPDYVIPKNQRPKSLIFMEFMLKNLPKGLFPLVITYPMMYVVDRENPITLISSVTPEYRTIGMVITFLMIDVTVHLFNLTTQCFAVFFTIAFILTFLENTAAAINCVKSENELTLEESLRTLRVLHLRMSLWNLCNKTIIYIAKIVCMVLCIAGGFSCIRLGTSNIPLAINYLMMFANGICIHQGMFDMAYDMTVKTEQLKNEILVKAKQERLPTRRHECRMYLKSVPTLGVKLGAFHTLDRATIPNFAAYVIEQIATLLIAFPP